MASNTTTAVFHKFTDVKFNELKFPKTKQTTGNRFLSVFYNKKKLGVKLPKLRIPFDTKISTFGSIELNLSLGANEDLISKVEEIDRQIVAFAEEHGWNTEDSEYVPMLKKSSGNAYPPTIRVKVPVKDGVIATTFFDENKQEIEVKNEDEICALLPKTTHILTAIECTGVWFMNGRYGISWKLSQARVEKPKPIEECLEECNFASDSDAESLSGECLVDDE
jgi:hypothetical protein